jgi:hypothetical protein
VDQVEHRVEVEGTEEEKEDLLPKLVGLRKAISDMTEHYDAKLSEVKERNQQALAELKKLQNRVKCAHERVPPPVAASPAGKENMQQPPDNASAEAAGHACCPPVQEEIHMDHPGPLIVPQPYAMWEPYNPCCDGAWNSEYGPEWHWWGTCSGGPTCEAEFFPGVPWATVQEGSPCTRSPRSPVSFVPTPSPDLWSSPSKFSGSLLLAPLSPNRSVETVDTVTTP